MISRIKQRLIYEDPTNIETQYEIEKKRYQQQLLDDKIRERGLIPSSSGPPARIYGQHLPTEDPEEEQAKKKKKKEKGVWYVPWYEDQEEGEPEKKGDELDTLALSTMRDVLSSLSDKKIVWDVETKKGIKSRQNFSQYILLLGVAMWRERKKTEDDDWFRQQPRGAGEGLPAAESGGDSLPGRGESGYGRGGGRGDPSSIGGPANSANTLRGGRGRGGRGGRASRPSRGSRNTTGTGRVGRGYRG